MWKKHRCGQTQRLMNREVDNHRFLAKAEVDKYKDGNTDGSNTEVNSHKGGLTKRWTDKER